MNILSKDLEDNGGTYFEQNADAEVHERFSEIDDTLSGIIDGH
jgi:hypothetical protein